MHGENENIMITLKELQVFLLLHEWTVIKKEPIIFPYILYRKGADNLFIYLPDTNAVLPVKNPIVAVGAHSLKANASSVTIQKDLPEFKSFEELQNFIEEGITLNDQKRT